jgi:hypothetical protein
MLPREVRGPGAHAELLDYLRTSLRTSRLKKKTLPFGYGQHVGIKRAQHSAKI